jgi:hypothetical protein
LADPGEPSPRVYISYSRDSDEHAMQVLEFSSFLRTEAGVDAHLDRWYDGGRRDWAAWAADQVGQADFIVAIASPEYKRIVDGRGSSTAGSVAEIDGALIRNSYSWNLSTATRRVLPVVLPGRSEDEIPDFLCPASTTNYVIPDFTLEGISSLVRAFQGSPEHAMPSLGPFRPPIPGADPIIVAVADVPPRPSSVLAGGAEVEIGENRFLLHGDSVEERPNSDGSAVERRSRALRIGPPHEQVWLRQIEVRHLTPQAKIAARTLGREHDLLSALSGKYTGLPAVIGRSQDGRVETLVTRWPVSRPSGRPCDTLASFLPEPGEFVDPLRMLGMLRDLAGLCRTLTALHRLRSTHRCLTPEGVIRFDDGKLALRDLGLAASDYEPGEGPGLYQAPEQRRRSSGRVGPWTDTYQVAAMAYHLVTGRPPGQPVPLPVLALAPGLPASAATALDAALNAVPAQRPDIRALAAAFDEVRARR